MLGLIGYAAAMLAQPAVARAPGDQSAVQQKHDEEVRARNAERDYFFVSGAGKGLSQVRFYIDRNTIRENGTTKTVRAWVDSFSVIKERKPIRLERGKALVEVRCDEVEPQLRFRTMVTYQPDGSAQSEGGTSAWMDIIPGTSMETQHRFICDSQPANAFYPVFNGNTPEKDAMSHYLDL